MKVAVCVQFLDETMCNVPCQRVQVGEIWQFVGAKQKNVTPMTGAIGNVWTWVAIDADTKPILCWMLGSRDAGAARDFMEDLARRPRMLCNRRRSDVS